MHTVVQICRTAVEYQENMLVRQREAIAWHKTMDTQERISIFSPVRCYVHFF